MRRSIWIGVCCLAMAILGCEIGAKSGAGLRLPNGDIAKGRQAFEELGCIQCHRVGVRSPSKDDDLIVLGGKVAHIETHGELVTSITNPSHGISRRYPAEDVTEGNRSKMLDFNARMTVEELIDITAYLQSKYELELNDLYGP